MEPGEDKAVPTTLVPGDYRVRTLESGGELDVTWNGGHFPSINLAGDKVLAGAPAPLGELALHNSSGVRRTMIIEDRSWRRDVRTAQRVTTLQAFRDLFSEQVLRADDEIRISTITFMFTDLVGSTSLFTQVGDARAYQIVREHFALQGGVVREYDGTIVKTIGDGLHVAFNAPDHAFHAAIAIETAVSNWRSQESGIDVAVRIGLHTGSSISVNLNGRLDYYGSSVNMAARLEGQGQSGEITMSEAFVNDAAVASLLSHDATRNTSVELKGFDEPVTVYQFRP